jgi:hypothetical protein
MSQSVLQRLRMRALEDDHRRKAKKGHSEIYHAAGKISDRKLRRCTKLQSSSLRKAKVLTASGVPPGGLHTSTAGFRLASSSA